MCTGYPRALPTAASEIPVDPTVPSYIVSPECGVRSPCSSACILILFYYEFKFLSIMALWTRFFMGVFKGKQEKKLDNG